MLCELLHVDIIHVSDTNKGLKNKFRKCKTCESKGLKVNLGITKVMASGGTQKMAFSKRKAYRCGVCGLRDKTNSTLCIQCGK